jgi:hypothetical protein
MLGDRVPLQLYGSIVCWSKHLHFAVRTLSRSLQGMATEVGAGRSAGDIQAVADPAWVSKIHSETGAEPFLDDDGAVVIAVGSGSGPVLQGAPSDHTIKLPALGAHQGAH